MKQKKYIKSKTPVMRRQLWVRDITDAELAEIKQKAIELCQPFEAYLAFLIKRGFYIKTEL